MQEFSSTIADPTAAASTPAAALRLRDLAPDAADAWLTRLHAEMHRSEGRAGASSSPPPRLAASYRAMALALIEHVARRLDRGADPGEWTPDAPLPGGLVREIRRAERPTWRVAADLDALLGAAFRTFREASPPLHDPFAFEALALVVSAAAVRLARVLDAAAARLQRERAAALYSMTEMLVHEFRNRLGAAETASQMLMNPATPSPDETWLARVSNLIGSSVGDAFGALNDVMSVIADETAPEASVSRFVSLPLLVQEVMAEMHTFAAQEGVELERAEKLAEMDVPARPLRVILGNLVRNGIAHHDAGRSRRVVSVSAEDARDGGLRLQVRDNGVGIAPGELGEVFSYRAGETDGGGGLGLAIVRETADRLGASLEVASEVGRGTTFTLTLPPLDG